MMKTCVERWCAWAWGDLDVNPALYFNGEKYVFGWWLLGPDGAWGSCLETSSMAEMIDIFYFTEEEDDESYYL